MKYRCPSCKIEWEDDLEPINKLSEPLCFFCSSRHTEKELLNWQMNQIDNINSKHHPLVIRNFYRYIDNELKAMREEIFEQKKENDREDLDSR